jgi:hypothetical protein
MKLQKIHLFIILLLALIFCGCLGSFLQEGMASQTTYTGSAGNSASVTTGPGGNTAVTGPGGNTAINGPGGNITGYNSGSDNYSSASSSTYTGSGGNSVTATTGPGGNTAVTGSGGNTTVANTGNNGIPYSQIPSGQQDLYILKSEVVPPVCPACPAAASCPRKESCPPCPACERCPEPAFECKKVPNYSSVNDNYLPRPVMSDFSEFGM